MGRQKIAIKRIKDERIRQVTYYKRKRGLLKKAMELSLLCGIDVFLSIVDRNSKVMIYSSADNIKKFVSKNFSDPEKAREVFLNRDYEDIFIKRTHLCQFKHMKKKKLLDELDEQINLSGNEFPEEDSDISDEDMEIKINCSKINNKKPLKAIKKKEKIKNDVNNSIEKNNNLINKEFIYANSKKRNLLTNKKAKDKLTDINHVNQKDSRIILEAAENKNVNFNKKLQSNKLNESYKKLPSNDLLVTETFSSKKNSVETVFSKYKVDQKLKNIDELSESTNNNFPILNSKNNINPFFDKNKISKTENINNINNTNFAFADLKNKCEIIPQKLDDKEESLISLRQPNKNESEGISKLKNKLSLKVKIPEDKSEKNNFDNSNSNNNNNYIADFENYSNQASNVINDELNVLKINPNNYSFKNNEITNINAKDPKQNKFENQKAVKMKKLNNEDSQKKSQPLNPNYEQLDINKNNNPNNFQINEELKTACNANNNYLNASYFNPSNDNNINNPNANNNNDDNSFHNHNNNDIGILSFPNNNSANEFLIGQNYFPFNNNNINNNNNELYQNKNNYLVYNDPILSARKRLREEYSNFSPLYSANLKAYTPLLSVNSPGMPGFFIFNSGQSIATTPLPFKIQNNIMLTSFFQPQNSNQNLNLNLNKNVENKSIKTPINNNFLGFNAFNNFNPNLNGSKPNSDKDENSTLKDNTIQDSSNSLDRAPKNNLNNENSFNKQNLKQNNLLNNKNNMISVVKDSENANSNKSNMLNNQYFNNNLVTNNIQNLANVNDKNNVFTKKNSQNLIFVPSPLPANNNFYGWILNNNATALASQNSQCLDLNLNESNNNKNKTENNVNNNHKIVKNPVDNKINKNAKKGFNIKKK